jgi:hypothetical protein
MSALQGSVMSLHEVSDIVPGQSFRARDLIRGGEPVLVAERTATRTLKPWDRIAARVVMEGGRSVLAGGVLAFTLEGSERLFAALRERAAGGPRRRTGAGKADGALDGWTGSDEDLRRAAPLFSTAWLLDVLPRALNREPPKVFNSDGDEVVFHTVRFPFAANATARDVVPRLRQLGELRQETPTFWNWLGPPPTRRPTIEDPKAVIWNVTLDDGSVVLGNIELQDRVVVLSASSAARAERGRAMLSDALTGLVSMPLTEIQTVEQMRAAAPRDTTASPPPVPPEVQTELVHEMLDRQYRAQLDEPVPMLGNLTPRAAARSARGRRNLAVWLKHLENRSSQGHDAEDPMATYDFTWLWRELKIEHLRA